jgi:Zn-dependent protease
VTGGFRIGRIAGVEIRLHTWWFAIVAIIATIVAVAIGRESGNVITVAGWFIGVSAGIGFMATVIAHELAHAIVARRAGDDIPTAFVSLFGTPASVDVRARRAADELRIALAGPLASGILGLVLLVIAVLLFQAGNEAVRIVANAVAIVAALNLVLAAVTILPAYPLDGGRVVRALVWLRTGDDRRGAVAAARVGRFVGWGTLAVGLIVILRGDTWSGVLVGVIGWLLVVSSRSIDRWVVLDRLIDGVRVGEALEAEARTLSPGLTLDTFAAEVLAGDLPPALPVVRDGQLIGLVGQAQIKRVPRDSWPRQRAEDVMIRPPEMLTLSPDETLGVGVDRLRRSRLDGVPVVDAGALLGMLTRRSVGSVVSQRADVAGVTL